MTKIEWTEKTWNPIVGCSVLTPGCTNCYAMKMAWRLANNPATPHYAGTVEKVKGKPVWTGKMAQAPDRVLTEPLRQRKPTTYFVNSMGDLFHEDVPDEWIAETFGVMAVAGGKFQGKGDGYDIGPSWTTSDGREVPTKWPRQKHGPHIFQVLTKRGQRMRDLMNSQYFRRKIAASAYRHAHDRTCAGGLSDSIESGSNWPLPNVWLGVSAERQREWDERQEHLRLTPAAVRFASFEPLLGAIDGIPDWLSWAICGGESGPGARPMHPGWARSLRDQCQAAQVPFFFKQWGEWAPDDGPLSDGNDPVMDKPLPAAWFDGTRWHFADSGFAIDLVASKGHGAWVYRFGKKTAGRILDGRTWDEMPGERNG